MLVQGVGECVDISQKTVCTVCAYKRECQANGLLLLLQTYNWGAKCSNKNARNAGIIIIIRGLHDRSNACQSRPATDTIAHFTS